MTDKEAIKYLQQLYPNGGHCWLDEQRIEAIDMAVKALQEEPVSEIDFEQELYKAFGHVKDFTLCLKIARRFYDMGKNSQEPVSEELEEAAREYADNEEYGDDVYFAIKAAFKDGAKWQKTNLWKPADGDDLPEYEREVIVLIKYYAQRNIHDEEYPTYRVGFGHRPNPDGWDGKNIDTNEVTHYTPKLYDKGGWNAPDIVYWLDIELPKEIEL